MKTLYLCQASTGMFAFTYAESKEEARKYFHELFLQYSPAWLSYELSTWPCPTGWFLAGNEEDYAELESMGVCVEDDRQSFMPFSLSMVKKRLQGYKERREERERRKNAKRK